MKVLRFFSVLVVLSILVLTACSSQDMTKVTIYFAKDKQTSLEQIKIPIIDRILNLFTTKAYAQHHDPANTDYYFLWVTADDIEGVYTPMIPGAQTSISLEVPSGDNRVFTILSLHSESYNYIGQTVANLTSGETNLTINMYPCLNNITATQLSNSMQIYWSFDTTLITEGFATLRIYKTCFGDDPSCGYTGAVTLVTSGLSLSAYSYEDFDVASTSLNPQIYYYFLSIDSPYSPNGGLPAPTNFMDYFSNYYFIAAYMMASGEYTWTGP